MVLPWNIIDEYVLMEDYLAIIHLLAVLVGIGYAQNYYFHLRKL